MEEEILIRQAIEGSRQAFTQLIQSRKETLYKTAFIYTKNREDALDAVSETVYKAFNSVRKLREPQYFSTWLTKILINSCLDTIKKNKKVIPLGTVKTYLHKALNELRLELKEVPCNGTIC